MTPFRDRSKTRSGKNKKKNVKHIRVKTATVFYADGRNIILSKITDDNNSILLLLSTRDIIRRRRLHLCDVLQQKYCYYIVLLFGRELLARRSNPRKLRFRKRLRWSFFLFSFSFFYLCISRGYQPFIPTPGPLYRTLESTLLLSFLFDNFFSRFLSIHPPRTCSHT